MLDLHGPTPDFVSISNVAADPATLQENAHVLATMLKARGAQVELLETGGFPAVFAEFKTPGANRTIGFYGHYDGQPADKAAWASDPWTPVFRDKALGQGGQLVTLPSQGLIDGEWRMFARSVSDGKGPIVTLLAAIDALKANKVPLSTNVKLYFDGEEEIGSPHLRQVMEKNAARMKADAWIMLDGPVHPSGRRQVMFGVRGVQALEMTVYGPSRGLHDGLYGNWAPNPAALLANLVASMRDGDGNVTIAGFYDPVRALSEHDRKALAAAPDADHELRTSLQLAWTEGGNKPMVERLMLAGLNVRGIQAGHVREKAANVIPTEAHASMDFRLVPDQTIDGVRRQVEAHIQKQGFYIVHQPPDTATRLAQPRIVMLDWKPGAFEGMRTPMDLPISRAVVTAVEEAAGEAVVVLPSMGASINLRLFAEVLQAPTMFVPTVNADNEQHAANENLRIMNIWNGIETFGTLLARIGQL